MGFTITQVKEHLTAMGHGGTLNKVRSFEAACERAANMMLSKVRLLETQRSAALVAVVGSDYDYTLPTDFLALIDLYRTSDDRVTRDYVGRVSQSRYDLEKDLWGKRVTIKNTSAGKVIRITWADETAFTIQYYSKYLFASLTDGVPTTYLSQPVDDDDVVLCDNDSLQIFLLELLKAIAHQVEGTDSMFDISFANADLPVLYQAYRGDHPDESIKMQQSYSNKPRFKI